MKFLVAIALIATVASATYVKPTALTGELADIQEIVAAINSPSTDPATAAALEQMLLDVLGIAPEQVAVGPAIIPEPISVGPALLEPEYEPISIEPALVDFPVEVPADAPVEVSPVAVAPGATPAAPTAPLVQIILNINQAAAPAAVETAPVGLPPVNVVELAPVEVVELLPVVITAPEVDPTPVQVVETAPTPVQVVETAPVAVEPVIIGTPVIPSPAVVLPDDLN